MDTDKDLNKVIGDWNVREDTRLLDAVEMFGFGNWKDISKHVETKNEYQVKERFIKCFINGPLGRATWSEDLRGHAVDHTQDNDRGPLSPTLTSPRLEPRSLLTRVTASEARLVTWLLPPILSPISSRLRPVQRSGSSLTQSPITSCLRSSQLSLSTNMVSRESSLADSRSESSFSIRRLRVQEVRLGWVMACLSSCCSCSLVTLATTPEGGVKSTGK